MLLYLRGRGGGSSLRIALADMSGEICYYKQLSMPESGLTEAVCQDFLVQSIEGMLADSGISREKLRAAAFGIPGVVDPADGSVSDLVAPLRGCEGCSQGLIWPSCSPCLS